MTLSVRDAGTWKAAAPFVRDAGTWKAATAYVRDAGTWKAGGGGSPVSAVVDISSQQQTYSHSGDPGRDTARTNLSTITASGGTAPYSYAWSRVSGYSGIAAESAASAATDFLGDPLFYPNNYSAIFQCLVTDSVGATATALVSVEFDAG